MTEKAFDYIIIDDSLDFPKKFFPVMYISYEEKLYIALNIFKSIFDDQKKMKLKLTSY